MVVCATACWLSAAAASAQLPSRPVTALGGRLVVGGTLSASIAPGDDRAYYNLSSYNTDLLRMVQFTLDGSLRVSDRLTLVAGATGQTAVTRWSWDTYPTALYLSARLSRRGSLAVRGGIVQPAFGAFMQHSYGRGNLLIGYPLAYQYATTLRADSFPPSADALLARRGFGAVTSYALGDTYREPGLPLVNPLGWNAGVVISAGSAPVHVDVALTRGGIARRLDRNGGGSWELSGRIEGRVGAGLVVGASLAHGGYIDGDMRGLVETATANRSPRETAAGVDVEYSRGYWLVRGEAIVNRRGVPAFRAPYLADPLRAAWGAAEVQYKPYPGLYLAARLERLSFSSLTGSKVTESWDANVRRLEVGGGYSLTRNIIGKLTFQRNDRDSHWYPRQQLVSAQVLLWF